MMNTQIGKEKITVTHPQTYSRLYDFFLADAVAAYHGGIDVDAVNEFVEHTLPYIAKVARTLDVISIPLSIFFCLIQAVNHIAEKNGGTSTFTHQNGAFSAKVMLCG